jgi:hypothetical protein
LLQYIGLQAMAKKSEEKEGMEKYEISQGGALLE